jgi:hypothetical protein
MNIFKAITKLVNAFFGMFHVGGKDVLDDATVKLMISVGVQEAILYHPEVKAPMIEVSQKVVDGIDGKLLEGAPDVMALIKQEIDKAGLDVPIKILVDGLMSTYAAQITGMFDTNGISDALAQLTELRKLAVLANNAAGGQAV